MCVCSVQHTLEVEAESAGFDPIKNFMNVEQAALVESDVPQELKTTVIFRLPSLMIEIKTYLQGYK